MSIAALKHAKSRLDHGLAAVLSLAMIFSVLLVLWQVLSRYVLTQPSSFTDEAVRCLLIWIGLLGGAQAAGKRLHLAILLLPERLSHRARHRLGACQQAVIGLFAIGALGIGGLSLVSLTFELGQTSAALALPLGWIYLVLPISGVLIAFYSALFAWDHLRQARGEAPLWPTEEGVN